MTDKVKSAELILKLYDLRREAVMREARNWFFTFTPESAADIQRTAMGEHGGYLRMVTTYWDMAASFVEHGAIDEEMFNDANGEHVFIFAKIEPFLTELREKVGPRMMVHLERVVMRLPDARERLEHVRQMSRRWAAARAEAAARRAAQG